MFCNLRLSVFFSVKCKVSSQICQPYSTFTLKPHFSKLTLVLSVGSFRKLTQQFHLAVSGCKYLVITNLYIRTSLCGATGFNLVIRKSLATY